jgi:peptidoglycan/xylan/chitin deacetylase (PgdA/CDA1 family)
MIPLRVPGRLLFAALLGVTLLFPATVSAAPGARVLFHGPRTRPVVALTFDDGAGSAACAALVSILEETHTPATFFPNAVYVKLSPRLWRHISALGFPIGNHTTSHPLMTRLPYRRQLAQIASDRLIVERIIGRRTIPVFRPPYGAFNGTTVRAATAAGYAYVLNWDATFADSSHRRGGSPWPITSYIRAATRGTDGSVILGHCGNRIDVAALRAVIASYRGRGFSFVTVPQLLGLPGAVPMTFPAYPPPPPPPPPRPGPPRAL